MADGSSLHQKQFEAAVRLIQSLPNNGSFQPSNEVMLRLYGYFKQATRGPCNISRPSFWDPLGRQKWDAWNAMSQMSKEEAMVEYVNEIKQILEMLPITDRVEDFLLTLGPFYEIVENRPNMPTKRNLNLQNISDYPKYLNSDEQQVKGRHMKKDAADVPVWDEHNGVPLTATTSTALKSLQKDETITEPKINCLHQNEHLQYEKSLLPERSLLNLPSSGCTHLQGVNSVADTSAKGSNPAESEVNSFTVAHEPLLMLRHVEGEGSASDEITISLNGRLKMSAIDGGVIVPHFTGDSDSEHYCDSMEHLTVEEAAEGMERSRAQLNCPVNDETQFTTHRGQQMLPNGSFRPPHFERKSKMTHNVEGTSREKNVIHYREGTVCASQCEMQLHGKEILNEDTEKLGNQAEKGEGLAILVDGSMEQPRAGSSSSGDGFEQSRRRTFNTSKQITITLQRLQEDMQRVLHQLGSLEALVSSQAMSVALSPTRAEGNVLPLRLRVAGKRTGLSRIMPLFLLAWPFFAQWIVHVILKRRR